MPKRNRLKKFLKWFFGVLAVLAVALQFFNPSLKNPPVEPVHDLMATNPPPPEVATLLRQACYDCHSYETKWPWYAHVAPISNWIVGHMNEGREHLNFSEWSHGDSYRSRKRLNRIGDAVESGGMPLPSYTWIHREARLTAEQRGRILKWAEQEAQRLRAEDSN